MTFQSFSGLDYLKIDIANNYGHDKESWDARLNWFNANEPRLESMIKDAEAPALFFAGLQAFRKAQRGVASGYPISLDATSSGIQLLACLTGDRKAAQLCNVVNTGQREDAYTGLYEAMVDILRQGTLAPVEGDEKPIYTGSRINRKDTKSAIMTAFYSSTAVPKQVFGEGELLDIFYSTMKEFAPGAWELTETMLAIWDPKAYVNSWVMPDNFNVVIKVMGTTSENVHFLNKPYEVTYSINQPIENGRSLGANMVHSIDGMLVREMARRCMYNVKQVDNILYLIGVNDYGYSTVRDKDKMAATIWSHYLDSGFLSARILDYLDNDNLGNFGTKEIMSLIGSLPSKPFEVLSVHDCFRCLPNYGNDLRKQYNQLLSEIAKSDLLSFLVSQMLKRKINVQKLDPSLYEDILEANYALS